MSTEPNKVIYSMVGVSKFYDKKPVLKDIYLSYFYGAKIGVLGLNASGKSSLLKILAGVDKDFGGQISLSPGYTTGYLEQEPRLDESKTVRQIVEQGVASTMELLNQLDAESVAWLEQHLQRYEGTVIAVTHDRYFLDNVAGWILELDRGAGIPWKGNYSSWLEQKKARLANEEKQESARQKTLARELEWIRQSPRARMAKSKARIAAYESLLAEDARKKESEVEIYIPPGPRLGQLVIKAEELSKGYQD